jgi:hypothetical protein
VQVTVQQGDLTYKNDKHAFTIPLIIYIDTQPNEINIHTEKINSELQVLSSQAAVFTESWVAQATVEELEREYEIEKSIHVGQMRV